MRIISGELRGRKLISPSLKVLRPISDRAKETLFNILGERVVGADFADLCAGTGSVGLEAISRGAKAVTFIERNERCIAALKENISRCRCKHQAHVIHSDVQVALRRLVKVGKKFDIIFADPPYKGQLALKLLHLLSQNLSLLADGGLIVIRHSVKCSLPDECGLLKRLRAHRVGEGIFSFYERGLDDKSTACGEVD